MRVECDKCHKQFASSYLPKHIAIVHNNEKPYKCEFCDFAASQKGNLARHSCYIRGDNSGNIYLECDVQAKLERETGGKQAVVPYGRIDILTSDQIIEIKLWKNWTYGVGQLIYYSQFYPDRRLRLHLFGRPPVDEKFNYIVRACELRDIMVTFERYDVDPQITQLFE